MFSYSDFNPPGDRGQRKKEKGRIKISPVIDFFTLYKNSIPVKIREHNIWCKKINLRTIYSGMPGWRETSVFRPAGEALIKEM